MVGLPFTETQRRGPCSTCQNAFGLMCTGIICLPLALLLLGPGPRGRMAPGVSHEPRRGAVCELFSWSWSCTFSRKAPGNPGAAPKSSLGAQIFCPESTEEVSGVQVSRLKGASSELVPLFSIGLAKGKTQKHLPAVSPRVFFSKPTRGFSLKGPSGREPMCCGSPEHGIRGWGTPSQFGRVSRVSGSRSNEKSYVCTHNSIFYADQKSKAGAFCDSELEMCGWQARELNPSHY